MTEVLQSEHYSSRLLAGFRSLLENKLLCDLTLVADGHAISVHRTVMAAASDYFQALLTLDMKEKSQKVIQLKGVPLKGLQEVIKFAYTGQLHCTFDNISDVLLAATHLQFTEAIELCSKYLTSLTSVVNCVDMYNISEQFNLIPLKEKAFGLILANFDEISKKDDFLRFSEAFLSKLLLEDRLKVPTELTLFELVLKWLNHSREERLSGVAGLMSKIRFPLIPPQDMVSVVMLEPLMKKDPQCLELVFEANKYHMLPSQQPLMQTERTRVRSKEPSLIMLDIDDEGPRVFDVSSRRWGSLRHSSPETYHAQVCAAGNYMYVCGGIELYSSNNPVSSKCYRYDPRFDTWAEIASMQEARHHFSLVEDGKCMHAIGGYCSGQYKNVVEKYVIEEDRWERKSPLDIRLSACAAAIWEGIVYVAGGQTEKGISKSLLSYDMRVDEWTSKPAMLQGRMDHAVCSYARRLFVFGGYDKNIIRAFDVNTVECYDIETEQWSVVFENAPKISGINCCLIDFKAYMVGGFTYDDNKKRSEVWCYDIKANQWQVATRIQSPAMSVPCCALHLPRHLLRDITV